MDFSDLRIQQMQLTDLNEVMAIEQSVYSHPWSRGNFVDAIDDNYDAWVARSPESELLGYFVHMPIIDELHLLTIAVKESAQGRGLGHFFLLLMVERGKVNQMKSVLLEVRKSNKRAIKIYESFGFKLVGRRKNYYQTNQHGREDALILNYEIVE